jgi:hypothetical protein
MRRGCSDQSPSAVASQTIQGVKPAAAVVCSMSYVVLSQRPPHLYNQSSSLKLFTLSAETRIIPIARYSTATSCV